MMLVGVPESTIWCVHFTGARNRDTYHASGMERALVSAKWFIMCDYVALQMCICIARVYMNYLVSISKSMEMRSKDAHTGELYMLLK